MFVFNTNKKIVKPGKYQANCLFKKKAQSPISLFATHQLAEPKMNNPKIHQKLKMINISFPSKGQILIGIGKKLVF